MKKAVIVKSMALNGLLNGKECEIIENIPEGVLIRYDGQRLLLLNGVDEFSIKSECKKVPGRHNYHICVYCGNTNEFYKIREIKESAHIHNDDAESEDIEWTYCDSGDYTKVVQYCSICERETITLKWEQYAEYCSGKGEIFEKIKKYKEIIARCEAPAKIIEEAKA